MRSDMAKVIVERPRIRGRAWSKPKGRQRRQRTYGEDGPPSYEGIRRQWSGGRKELNEHLGPLRRYLDSQVGRPWDRVFSEICTHINRNSAVQDHVRDHVDHYVIKHVVEVDGEFCCGDPGGWYGRPLAQCHWRPWYVCPRSGLLRRIPRVARKRSNAAPKRDSLVIIPVNENLQCRRMEGHWYLVTFEPLPPFLRDRERCTKIDVLSRLPVAKLTPVEARRRYGAAVFASSCRRMRRTEIKHYPIPIDWIA